MVDCDGLALGCVIGFYPQSHHDPLLRWLVVECIESIFRGSHGWCLG